jgi:NAD(P)-dependent dehydrogenase (short-subunit alcohol dehydrogenase family)
VDVNESAASDAADLSLVADLRSGDSVAKAISAAVERLGRLDIVVNNAGIGATGDVTANDDDEWHRLFDVNVVGIARTSRAALPHLRRSPNPAIVNVSSVVAEVGVPDRALYSATKGAVAALTRAMAADHVKDGIRVNAVLPGTTDTPWVGRLMGASADPAGTRSALEARQPLGRLLTADEIALAICYLASPTSSGVTGTLLSIDGGMAGLRLPAKPAS